MKVFRLYLHIYNLQNKIKLRFLFTEQLFNFLKGLRIDIDEEDTYFQGNLKKLICETFVKQLYLKREKSDSETDMETRYVHT